MDKRYDAKAAEAKWYPIWEKNGYFHAEPSEGGTPYSVVIPPPNVTGILHMGHALKELLAPEILTAQALLVKRLLDDALRGNAGVVRARNPERVAASLAAIADENVL